MRTFYEDVAAFVAKEPPQNPAWKRIRTYTDVAAFYDEAGEALAGRGTGALQYVCGESSYSKRQFGKYLGDIVDAYRSKAAKGRPSTTLSVFDARYRFYIALQTDPGNEVIAWHWWKQEDYNRIYDVNHTFGV